MRGVGRHGRLVAWWWTMRGVGAMSPTSSLAARFKAGVLYEDNHVVVYDKPNGVLSQGDRTGDPSVNELCLAWLMEERKTKYAAAVHRLDRPCSGALLIAVTSKAAKRLSESMAAGRIRKSYVVAVADPKRLLYGRGWLADALTQSRDAAVAARRTSCARIAHLDREPSPEELAGFQAGVSKPAQFAALEYTIIKRAGGNALLTVALAKTGRRHQIRAQLAALGAPVLGDAKYGPRKSGKTKHATCALHASMVTAPHPIAGRPPIQVIADLPPTWSTFVPASLVRAAHHHLQACRIPLAAAFPPE